MVHSDLLREPNRLQSSLEKRVDRCIATILCLLVLLNIALWLARLCFHVDALNA